jgi:hypothetical protein
MGACMSLKVSRPSRFSKLATVSIGNWGHLSYGPDDLFSFLLLTFDSSLNLVRFLNFEGIFVYCMT